jgi:hypothetical protein
MYVCIWTYVRQSGGIPINEAVVSPQNKVLQLRKRNTGEFITKNVDYKIIQNGAWIFSESGLISPHVGNYFQLLKVMSQV